MSKVKEENNRARSPNDDESPPPALPKLNPVLEQVFRLIDFSGAIAYIPPSPNLYPYMQVSVSIPCDIPCDLTNYLIKPGKWEKQGKGEGGGREGVRDLDRDTYVAVGSGSPVFLHYSLAPAIYNYFCYKYLYIVRR